MGQTDKHATPPAPVATTEGTPLEQTPDTPGQDENGDGLTGGQTTADNFGDVLGV